LREEEGKIGSKIFENELTLKNSLILERAYAVLTSDNKI
jgi:hypothetical protein